jgi:4-amino-4-deoxy-L-arabinose transferase-like glycosyltransferase
MRWPVPAKFPPLLLLLALALAWFANTGLRTLTEPDEGRYAEVPREMLATGDWGMPHLDGIPYLEKPPLQYWATASLYRVLGAKAWVSRLWTTGLGFGCVLLIGISGWRRYGPRPGVYAALVLASAPLFFGVGHINTLDMGLTFFLTLALCAFLEGGPRAMLVVWLALALAMLQKGLVAVVLPAFALVLYVLGTRDLRVFARLRLVPGLAILLGLNLPWWLYMQRANPDFLGFFFIHEHFTRFATHEHARQQPWWYFSVVLAAGLLPWLVPVVRGALAGFRRDAGAPPGSFEADRFVLVWAVAVFVFFAPSGSKLAPYILPMLPPLALLAGRELGSNTLRSLRPTLWIAAAVALAMLLARPLLPLWMAPGFKRDTYLAVGLWMIGAGVVLALATLAAIALIRMGGPERAHRALCTLALGLVASFAILLTGTNALEAWRGGPGLAEDVAPWLDAATPLYCVGFYPQTLVFALGRTCTTVGYYGELEIGFDPGGRHFIPDYADFVDRWRLAPRAVAVVDPATWPRLEALGIPATIVAREPTALVIHR